jgi:hypothetical protein
MTVNIDVIVFWSACRNFLKRKQEDNNGDACHHCLFLEQTKKKKDDDNDVCHCCLLLEHSKNKKHRKRNDDGYLLSSSSKKNV